ncbi:LAME_0G09120g1_1 [Lachancea meyersii CBS 8951]|uniref:Probable metalloprotease ARX1 n=1 Tax=Lachancea meyersii CBS 8951 TaxID=1266667 RepID=A0A1G4K8N6_9SACH|nr:LAME_0G09120g1_1 [Lachancea meyersii CBS 8951]
MALAISREDTQVLLHQKNVLQESTLDKYRSAGQITQTGLKFVTKLINDSYHTGNSRRLAIHEICLLSDSFLAACLESSYKNKVAERGISHPTTIDVDEVASGWCPEVDDVEQLRSANKNLSESGSTTAGCQRCVEGYLAPGDVVKITLGVHIDGYTAQVSHSVVIYPTEDSENGSKKPAGPLLGGKADAYAAVHIAMETVVSLLACALTPEKIPRFLTNNDQVTGHLIRTVVDTIAASYHCTVVPGSKVRRVRRFLAGQNEGIVAEREYKGVAWYESHQELALLQKSAESTQDLVKVQPSNRHNSTAVPTDEFAVTPGEAYAIDIQMAPLDGVSAGLVTLENADNFSGKSHRSDQLIARPGAYVRDFAHSYTLKLKTSRQLLGKIDRQGVYPVKLSYMSDTFPIDVTSAETSQMEAISKDLKSYRLGMSEISNNFLAIPNPIRIAKCIPWEKILNTANPAGSHGIDATERTLPGQELPLPRLGISSLKLKSLLKHAVSVPVARQSATVVLCTADVVSTGKSELLRLTGGNKTCQPSWIHSAYQLNKEDSIVQGIFQLAELSKDKRFGLSIRETQPLKKETATSGFMSAPSTQDVEMA